MSNINITIPTTYTENNYTLYRIDIKLPLRKYVIDKRYSDFVALMENLNLSGNYVPYELPPKSFFKKTFGSSNLIEDRKIGLERFIQALIKDDNYNSSKLVKSFLNLPDNFKYSSKMDNVSTNLIATTDYKKIDSYKWLELFRDLKQSLQEARSFVISNPVESKKLLLIIRKNASLVSSSLDHLNAIKTLSAVELKRRNGLMEGVNDEIVALERLLSEIPRNGQRFPGTFQEEESAESTSKRDELFRGHRVLGSQNFQETQSTLPLSNQQLLQVQRQQHSEQDQEVEQLRQIIQRQKSMGIAINEELLAQNELLDELDGSLDQTDKKLRYARKKAGYIS